MAVVGRNAPGEKTRLAIGQRLQLVVELEKYSKSHWRERRFSDRA